MRQLLKLLALVSVMGLTACGPQVGGHKQENPMTGGGGGGNDNNSTRTDTFTQDRGERTSTPPAADDNAGTPASTTGGGDQATGGVPTESVTPTRAEPGEEATTGGFERPEQGGDVQGFKADTGQVADTPSQPDN